MKGTLRQDSDAAPLDEVQPPAGDRRAAVVQDRAGCALMGGEHERVTAVLEDPGAGRGDAPGVVLVGSAQRVVGPAPFHCGSPLACRKPSCRGEKPRRPYLSSIPFGAAEPSSVSRP